MRFLVIGEITRTDPRFLERFDLPVDLGKGVLVRDAVVMAARLLGDLPHELLVDAVGRDVLVGIGGHGHRADRVDLHVEQLRHVARVYRRDVSAVVLPICEQDDEPRLRIRVAKHVDRRGEAGPDRRAPGERSGVYRRDELL